MKCVHATSAAHYPVLRAICECLDSVRFHEDALPRNVIRLGMRMSLRRSHCSDGRRHASAFGASLSAQALAEQCGRVYALRVA
jgi:hypothetical protein